MDQSIGMCLVVYCTHVCSMVFSAHLFFVVLFIPFTFFGGFVQYDSHFNSFVHCTHLFLVVLFIVLVIMAPPMFWFF